MYKQNKIEKTSIISKDIKNNLQKFINMQEVVEYCKENGLNSDEISLVKLYVYDYIMR